MQSKIKALKKHCAFCFDTLVAHLQQKALPPYPADLPDAKVPIFVTWKKNEDLRGCIGTFRPDNLSTILSKYALIAAVNDSRFSPINKKELSQLSVGVSLLVNFEKGKKCYDWEVGKHGIVIDIEDDYNATFLPEVAPQQSWDKKQTLKHLIRKAGFPGTLQQAQPLIKLTTYESSKEYLTYEQYLKGEWK